MSWFRLSSLIFGFWAVGFSLFPGFVNRTAGLHYLESGHTEDWTRLVGLLSLGFAVLLDRAHRSASFETRRTVALGTLIATLSCALVMTYWQLVPDRRWFRWDLVNIGLLYLISYGMLRPAGLRGTGYRSPPGSEVC